MDIRVEITETIERPIEDVFQQLVDIDGYPAWMPENGFFVTCRKNSEGPIDVGTTYTDVTRLGTVHGEITTLDRPRKVVFRYVGRVFGRKFIQGWPGYTLERAGENRTRVRHHAEAILYGPAKLLRPAFRGIARMARRETVEALKGSLESGPDS